MNKEEEIQAAWTLWHLMARLNEVIWDRYENEFIERYLNVEEEKVGENQSETDLLWDPG